MEECYRELVEDPHVLMFANADDYYDWNLITQFNDDSESERWTHNFVKKHGNLIVQFDHTKLPTMHKFSIDADIFNQRIWATEEGRQYLKRAQEDETGDVDVAIMPQSGAVVDE